MKDIRKGFLITALLFLTIGTVAYASGTLGIKEDDKMQEFISELMEKMTMREKLGQLSLPSGGSMKTGAVKSVELGELIRKGEIGGFFNVKGVENIKALQDVAVKESRLGIPLLAGADIIHGYETIFPIPLAMSCSWNPEAVRRMARISAEESAANGIGWTYSPMVDICQDARWGRVAEGSGEDPYLGAVLAKAYVEGYQGDDLKNENSIMSCLKHFALYGAGESGRDYMPVDMSRQRMRNEYLEPYKAAVEAGVGSVMSSFNTINGVPATACRWLLTDLLRDEWGFGGFVVTDYNSIDEMSKHGYASLKDASAQALEAGTDMDMVSEGYISTLEESLREERVTEKQIDDACRRILEAKYKLGLFDNPYKYCNPERSVKETFTPGKRKIARDIAAETFVLLKNSDNLLPLRKKGKIALIGPMADAVNNMCGMWSMTCRPEKHRSLLAAFRDETKGKAEILHSKGSNIYYDANVEKYAVGIRPLKRGDDAALLREALNVASQSDVIVAALGESADMTGESASRTNLDIPDAQKDLLRELVKTGKPVVLVLFTGRPLTLCWEDENVPAILNVWYAGSEAGDAIADVIFGKKSPCGKLTTSFPRSVGQLPLHYNHMNTGRPDNDNSHFHRYASNWIDESNEPLYPFGYGLSYTDFTYGDVKLSSGTLKKGGKIEASVKVTNSGNHDGTEIVQLYLHDILASLVRPVKELKGFRRVTLKKGESEDIVFEITGDDLKFYNGEERYVYEPGEFELMIGPNSRDVKGVRFTAE